MLLGAPKEHRYSMANTRLLIHQPLIGGNVQGQASDLEITAKEIIKTRKNRPRFLFMFCRVFAYLLPAFWCKHLEQIGNKKQIIKNKIRNLNKQDANYTPLNLDLKREIFSVYFEEDVAQLEKLLNKKMDWN